MRRAAVAAMKRLRGGVPGRRGCEVLDTAGSPVTNAAGSLFQLQTAPHSQCAWLGIVCGRQVGREHWAAPLAGVRQPALSPSVWCQQAARRGFADEAADTPLAPCERPAVEQQSNELDGQLQAAAGSGGAGAVLALIEQHAERFTELNVVSAMRALAAAASGTHAGASSAAPTFQFSSPEEIVKADGFQALVDMVLAGLQRFPPALLAEAVHACGQLGASEEMLLDEIGRHIMRHVSELGPSDILHLAAGYAALDHAPSPVLFDAMAERAASIAGQFSAEQRRALGAAYEALDYGAKAPFKP